MATIVFLHAHPDDEASQTSGSMARAAAEGHRVVMVFATNGDHGEAPDDLAPGETVVERRRREALASAEVLGVQRVAWLGYSDSGMSGWEQNGWDRAFARADVEEAAHRVAAILDEEAADVLVGYDWHGGYGHPDHVRVHVVAHRAAELAAVKPPRLLESTMNRDAIRTGLAAARAAGLDVDEAFDPDAPMDDGNPLGSPESDIHWQVDVAPWLEQRRASLASHASQATDIQGMLSVPAPAFAAMFGTEHYIEPGRPDGMVRAWWMDEAPSSH